MDRGTLKSSTIFIATRDRTEVYRTLEEIPVGLRRRLRNLTSGGNAATVLIADRRGARELLRLAAQPPAPSLFRALWDLLRRVLKNR